MKSSKFRSLEDPLLLIIILEYTARYFKMNYHFKLFICLR